MYFCCLEALQNAAKYSGASRAVVRLDGDEAHVGFSVEDDEQRCAILDRPAGVHELGLAEDRAAGQLRRLAQLDERCVAHRLNEAVAHVHDEFSIVGTRGPGPPGAGIKLLARELLIGEGSHARSRFNARRPFNAENRNAYVPIPLLEVRPSFRACRACCRA